MSFILIAQQAGFTRQQIREHLAKLPEKRTPTQEDWTHIGKDFRQDLQQRIDSMTRMRDKLDGCIGCGCPSLEKCELYNPEDRAHRFGVGPRYVLEDHSADQDQNESAS